MEGFEGFSGGTARERNLLIGLGVLAVGFVVWLLLRSGGGGAGVEPAGPGGLGGGDIDTALRELQTVQSALASRPADAPDAGPREPLERATLVRRAQGAGLVISRLEPGPDGEVSLAFDDAPSQTVMRFLRDVAAGTAADITELDIAAAQDELVEASVTLTPTGN